MPKQPIDIKHDVPYLRDYFGFNGKNYFDNKMSLDILNTNGWKGIPFEYPETKHLAGEIQKQQNIEAFLKVIRRCEGTDGPNGYIMLFGGGTFDNMRGHPNKVVTEGEYSSTAAGAYQILYKTWRTVIQPKAALPDFGPESQDKAAKVLIKNRDAMIDVEVGKIESATRKCSWEWASMPPGRYGDQPTKPMDKVRQYFVDEGGTLFEDNHNGI